MKRIDGFERYLNSPVGIVLLINHHTLLYSEIRNLKIKDLVEKHKLVRKNKKNQAIMVEFANREDGGK